jgi:formylglycine-generating enzyme required for sulfatase activity
MLARPMVVIPAGTFLMGTRPEEIAALASAHGHHPSWMDGELPQRLVFVAKFAIDMYPVTQRQFAIFCAATGYPPRSNWIGGMPPMQLLDHPVTHLNRSDARAYAGWLGKRLPTEEEWEKAARGVDGRMFPWGNVFDPNACHWNRDPLVPESGTAPVTAHPSGASPYGVQDMVGNAAEWCNDGHTPWTAFIKGGAWISREVVNLRPAARNMSGFANNPAKFYGFRCARNVP